MNHNKIHAKIMMLLTLPKGKVWAEATPAYLIILILLGISLTPLPTFFNMYSLLIALLIVITFNIKINSNKIKYNIKAIEEAPVNTEKVEEKHIHPEETITPIEEVEEEAPVSSALEIMEDVDDLFDFNASLHATYDRGVIEELARAGARTTSDKANQMMRGR